MMSQSAIISRPETEDMYAMEIRLGKTVGGIAAQVFVNGKWDDEAFSGSGLMKAWGLTRAEADLIDRALQGAATPAAPRKRRAVNGFYDDPESQGDVSNW